MDVLSVKWTKLEVGNSFSVEWPVHNTRGAIDTLDKLPARAG